MFLFFFPLPNLINSALIFYVFHTAAAFLVFYTVCPSTISSTYTELIKTFCFPCLYAANQRIVWNAMQHSVRFNILFSFSLFVPGLLPAIVLCTLCGSEKDVWILCGWGMHWIVFQALDDVQSASSGTCKSQWYAAVGVLSLSHVSFSSESLCQLVALHLPWLSILFFDLSM